jgi:hypothetical protein
MTRPAIIRAGMFVPKKLSHLVSQFRLMIPRAAAPCLVPGRPALWLGETGFHVMGDG